MPDLYDTSYKTLEVLLGDGAFLHGYLLDYPAPIGLGSSGVYVFYRVGQIELGQSIHDKRWKTSLFTLYEACNIPTCLVVTPKLWHIPVMCQSGTGGVT